MDTIAAIATARGQAALAIVRMSGPEALPIVDRCHLGEPLRNVPSHTAHFRRLSGPHGETIDEVVITLFRAPRSATGEDVVEISSHGGDLIPQLILKHLIDEVARLEEPGEFSGRAFLNGKMDLAQAEAVADLIHASSSRAHRVSLAHLRGSYSELIHSVRDRLLEVAALVELELDFTEEDVEFAERSALEKLLEETEKLIDELLGSYRLGALVRDGVRVVIGGRPNAGKSTLLNALVGRDRAIVSEIPGTTRDEIEAEAEFDGFRFLFIDTAGLRETADFIESEGVRRAEHSIKTGDLLLYVYDVTHGLDAGEQTFLKHLESDLPGLPVIRVGNKVDLLDEQRQMRDDRGEMLLSAKKALLEGKEVANLRKRLVETIEMGQADQEASHVVVNERHRRLLLDAKQAVARARDQLDTAYGDTLSLELRTALDALGAIVGEVTTEDILGQIFSRFCIGK